MAISHIPRGPVMATLKFIVPPTDGSPAFNNLYQPEDSSKVRNWSLEAHEVTIQDMRGRESDFTLDKDAFAVVRNVPASRETEGGEKLLLDNVPGSNRVVFFDHTIWRDRAGESSTPVFSIHIDQTPKSAERRVRAHQPEIADELLRGRYRIVNVWRTLNENPLEASPLALASSATVKDEQVLPIEQRNRDGYRGQTAGVKHDKHQQWYYLSGMTGDERLLIECFDSKGLKAGSGVQGGRVPHTAFTDPRTRADAEVRESIEVRALVFGP